ncbi:hypothetical protein HOLleu_40649 [Holothuria leucospilota]|uniref:Uncharacterized protein n=1 Tax=Holothuria leucospilota TaxID=206669 RepID=A0A9Q1BDR1_HOLLE|nr:hypothetical protein HOLleu_40649 [Holothuria leucospilota]
MAKYPWIKDPKELPDNRQMAVVTLKSLEKRLGRDPGAGPGFLALPSNQWPVAAMRKPCQRVKVVMVEDVEEINALASKINVRKYSCYDKL